jgi:hypothetical protein
MSEKITYLLKALVDDGPVILETGALSVDAYDKLVAVVPAAGSVVVDVQPASGGQLLTLTASAYKDLTFEVDSSGTTPSLDGPLFLIGAAALELLGPTQNQFEFSNAGTTDITINILVGRDATPTP